MVGFIKKLFGGGGTAGGGGPEAIAAKTPDEIYKDIEIRAAPMKEAGGQWRIAGTLTKTIDGEPTMRRFVRADLVQSQEEAVSSSVSKAKMIIDQNGAYIWNGDPEQPV